MTEQTGRCKCWICGDVTRSKRTVTIGGVKYVECKDGRACTARVKAASVRKVVTR